MPVDLTFVVAIRNEDQYLDATCSSLREQQLENGTAEVLLVDGMSTDRSLEICRRFEEASAGSRIVFRVLSNAEQRTPFAFNIGIDAASGWLIGFGGAHTIYPSGYFAAALHAARTADAEVYGGGHTAFIPSTRGIVGEAMSLLYQSPMGSGVAAYHRRNAPGYVDTVYGGFYRREVFDRIGRFNTRLARNQDNELNSRVTSAGLRIYFDPALSTDYIFKADWKTFVTRGFRFGQHHPSTWRMNPSAFKLRHAIPGAFALYLVALFAGAAWWPIWAWFPLALYAVLLILAALRLMTKASPAAALLAMPLFFLYHASYGLGTLAGVPSLFRGAARGE